ncbi:MAG: tetrahydromethanopterin S-methyltransferase subunit H family protein [Promethearchaeota archaeon]
MTEYEVYTISGVTIGGKPGKNPVVMIGSIFYSGHKIVEDSVKGIFDKEKAEELINKCIEYEQDKYYIPGALDVVSEGSEATIKYLEFLVDRYPGPFVLDGFYNSRMAGLKRAEEMGIMDRIIYNSIWLNPPEELELIKEVKVQHAIIFSFDSASTVCDAARRWMLVTTGLKEGKKGLIQQAKDLGIKNLLIDNVLTDYASLADAIEANIMMKSQLGYPVGCGPANVSYHISKFELKKVKRPVREAALIGAAQIFSDFLLYGPIEQAEIAYSAASIIHKVKSNLNIDFSEF